MKTNIPLTLRLALLLVFSVQPSALFAQGSLTPPGAPAPTMKTLAQIEPRTPISAAPYSITNAGSYYLTANLTVTTGNAITILTNGVTLDLDGFTITSTAASATGYGILLTSNLSDITISNGHIKGGVTNTGGVYGGPGFQHGIHCSGTAPVNTRVAGVSVSGCQYQGIYLSTGDSTVVESCTVRTVGGSGIVAGTIKSSVAVDCGDSAIYGDQVSDSRGESAGGGYGLWSGASAQNCYGYSRIGYGLLATTALNCYGASTSGYGLYASSTAQNCLGSSSAGTGLYAYIAVGCRGYSGSGTGLSATLANSCLGSSVSATYKYNMP